MSRLCRECSWWRKGVCNAAHVPDPSNLRKVIVNPRFLDHVVQEPTCSQWLIPKETIRLSPRGTLVAGQWLSGTGKITV